MGQGGRRAEDAHPAAASARRLMPPKLRMATGRIRTADTSIARLPPKVAEAFYLSPEWRALVASLIAQRGRRCEVPTCGASGPDVRIIGDHIVERRDGGAELDPTNIRLVCLPCHNRKTARARDERMARPA